MTTLGNLFLGLAALGSLLAVISLFWGRAMGPKEGESVTNLGYYLTFGVLGALTVSTGTLLAAFFRQDFTFQYVVENHSTDASSIAWLYKISGVWAGREGSLLFWAWLVAIFGAYIAWKRMTETDELSNMSLAVFNIVQIFFTVALLIPLNNPFKVSPAQWLGPDGQLLIQAGMNPLLQHWAMILHPPTLFVGYAGLAVPFAFAMGALIVSDGSTRWVKLVDRITVFSWLFLGIGIGLGAIWAYWELSFGGFWAWDPVENASLLPWLTGVGLLHSFTVYRRRGGFKKWAVWMSTVSFVLVILGTFITRSGVVQSVHAFQRDNLSLWLFGAMMVLPIIGTIWGLMVRSEEFKGADEFDSMISKESSYYFNNVLMLLAAVFVALLTLSPALGGKTYGAPTYDSIARPVGILYAFIMAVCPLLAWRKTDGKAFWGKVKWPLVGTAVVSIPLLYLWYSELLPVSRTAVDAGLPLIIHNFYAVAGIVVGAFAASIAVFLFIEGARKRAKAKGEGFFSSLGQIMIKARTQSGGYLTHLGIGIILIGLVGAAMFVNRTDLTIANQPGETFQVSDYTFTYTGVEQQTLPNGDIEQIFAFDSSRNGGSPVVLRPNYTSFAQQGQVRVTADIDMGLIRDVFLVVNSVDENQIQLRVAIHPLISWAWIGFVIMIVGTSLASWPKKQTLNLIEAAPKGKSQSKAKSKKR